MSRWSLRLKLTLAYVILAIVCTVAIGTMGYFLQRQTYLDDLRERLSNEAVLATDYVVAGLDQRAPLEPVVHRISRATGARVTVIGVDGWVLADSTASPEMMENHAQRPEVAAAMAGQSGQSSRTSATTGEASYYVAVPIAPSGPVAGVLRLAVPLTEIDEALRRITLVVAVLTGLGAALAAALTLIVTRVLTVPLRELNALVKQAGTGRLSARLPVRSRDELGQLAEGFNQMSAELNDLILRLSLQRDETEAILGAISDGLLIVDDAQRVQRINATAMTWFATDLGRARGRPLIEVTRDHELVGVVAECLRSGATQRQVIERTSGPRVLSVTITPLRRGDRTDALVTLHDATEMRQLEQIRRQFVANISHELRTPLANIKLMVETLQEDPSDIELSNIFLGRINDEIDSLTQLVRELLGSRAWESGQAPLVFTAQQPDALVLRAIERLRAQAERRGIQLSAAANLALLPAVAVDRERLIGVLINLLHNAIKFTPPGGSVAVGGEAGAAEIHLWVRDTGIGIAPEELARVFERFYKVDKARSSGGTGLGLAIVKHTIQAHGGRVWAESAPGAGSTFHFTLPYLPVAADAPAPALAGPAATR